MAASRFGLLRFTQAGGKCQGPVDWLRDPTSWLIGAQMLADWYGHVLGGKTMRKLILTAALVCGASAAFADPVEGVWQTQEDDGAYAHVVMAPCGPNFCGKIARTFKAGAEYQSENLGKTLVIDMAPQSGGEYEGQVWRPSNNKIYYGTVTLNGDSLKLAGCVAGGLICSKQTWTRLK